VFDSVSSIAAAIDELSGDGEPSAAGGGA